MGADLSKYEIVGTGLRVYFPGLKSALIDQPKAPNRQIGGLSGGIDGGLAAKIIELIRADDTVTVSEMAESLGIPKRTIEREMKRAIIIGSPGAGKSTFARQVRDITGLPLYYLDMIWHLPDRITITKDEFDQKLMDILKTNTWIIHWRSALPEPKHV